LLAEATDQLNRRQVPRLAELILSKLPQGGTVGILGLSYKPDTDVIEESQGLALAKHLLVAGVRIAVHDPAAMENAKRHLIGDVLFARNPRHCAGLADVLVITTPWPEYGSLLPEDLKDGESISVLDCWRILSEKRFEEAHDYLTLGHGADTDRSSSVEEQVGAQAEGD